MGMSGKLLRPSGRFTPKSVPGLFGWWDFSDSATVTLSGSSITAVADKSGNGRNATQASANNQPTLATAAKNGRNAADFDGTNDALDASIGSAQFTAMTVFAVVNADTAGGGSVGRIYERASQGSNLNRNNANTAIAFAPPWSGATGNASQRSAASSFPLSTWLLVGVRYTGGTITETDVQPRISRASSTASLTGVSSGLGVSQSTTLNIGNRDAANGYDRGWDGKIGELVIYSASLSDSQVAAVEAYLASKWGF